MSPPAPNPQPDVVEAHRTVAPRDALLRDRRAVYRLAALLLDEFDAAQLPEERLDSPLLRHAIGEALAGRGAVLADGSAMDATDSLTVRVGALRLVADSDASTKLAAAVQDIQDRRDFGRSDGPPLRLLTRSEPPRFTAACGIVEGGVALVSAASSELIADLLPHVSLVAVVEHTSADGLLSASSRQYPGLIVLEEPRTALQAAEALVHEAAHQKLFDLEITHEFYTDSSQDFPLFEPPWHSAGKQWNIEQAMAAAHAYACLSRFASDLRIMLGGLPVEKDSLLPFAAQRRDLIGTWLLGHSDFIGSTARRLLTSLTGQSEEEEVPPLTSRPTPGGLLSTLTDQHAHRIVLGDRTLVGVRSRPPTLFWIGEGDGTQPTGRAEPDKEPRS
jgi:hypothetical protein